MAKRGFYFDSDSIIENIVVFDDDEVLTSSQKFEEDVSGVAEIGKYFDVTQNSVYLLTSPINGWVLNTATWEYESPTPNPSTELNFYDWDESSESWSLTETRNTVDDEWQVV